MAEPANSIAAPAGAPPSLWRLRGLFLLADAAREVVISVEADDQLDTLCDRLLTRLIYAPIRDRSDDLTKLWLLNMASERGWDHSYCAGHVVGDLRRFIGGRVA